MPFSPSDITGLKVWLKADQIGGADNDPVGTWADQSGQANDFTQSGAARQCSDGDPQRQLPSTDGLTTSWKVSFNSAASPSPTRRRSTTRCWSTATTTSGTSGPISACSDYQNLASLIPPLRAGVCGRSSPAATIASGSMEPRMREPTDRPVG
jgi:hypothetical protein